MKEKGDHSIIEKQTFEENAAVIKVGNDSEVYTSYEYELRVPKQYTGDFMVQMRASDLRKVRKCCNEAKKSGFSRNEFVLWLAGISLGAIISAIIGGVPFREMTFPSILCYYICPILTIIMLISYFYNRKENIGAVKDFIEKVEEYIIDPDKDTQNEKEVKL